MHCLHSAMPLCPPPTHTHTPARNSSALDSNRALKHAMTRMCRHGVMVCSSWRLRHTPQ